MKSIIFEFTDGTTHDASVTEISLEYPICFCHKWSILPVCNITGDVPTYTIEVSNNGVDWSPYADLVVDAQVNQPFDDTHFLFTHVRINYVAGATTTGTVTFEMIFK